MTKEVNAPLASWCDRVVAKLMLTPPRRGAEAIFRRARFFDTHAPRDKENQPEMPERKHAGAPLASGCDRVVAKLTP